MIIMSRGAVLYSTCADYKQTKLCIKSLSENEVSNRRMTIFEPRRPKQNGVFTRQAQVCPVDIKMRRNDHHHKNNFCDQSHLTNKTTKPK